jgi:Icc-related predicted phosphoesterase
MIIDCIGCLHGNLPQLEGGDLLIVSGDLTAVDSENEMALFDYWLNQQNYATKIIIGGNHDNVLADKRLKLQFGTYLLDSGCSFNGFKIWGSPWTAQFKGINPKCCAFTIPLSPDMEDRLMDKWELIPHDTDILVTHSPAFGVLDGIPNQDGSLFHVGSKSLYGWLKYIKRPRLHVFSHIHEGYGQEEHFPIYDNKMMISVNCSIMNERYNPVNKPIRIVL